MKRIRADEALSSQLKLANVDLARALIMEGRVMAGDRKILAVSEQIGVGETLRVRGDIDGYVSRGAYKLKRALEVFFIDLRGRNAIDIGASTGGFTDVMLRAGAAHVTSVDVGYNLLDYRLRSDARVDVLERTNARYLTREMLKTQPEFGATDVSFISLKLILPAALPLLTGERREFVALIKPQFEAAREDVGEKGVVRDRAVHKRVLEDILDFVPNTGWRVAGLDYSPVRGPEGNIEFLLYLLPAKSDVEPVREIHIDDTITAAYDKLFKSPQEDL